MSGATASSAPVFSALGAEARLAALADAASLRPVAHAGSNVTAARATIDGRPVILASFDRKKAGGSLGAAECAHLAALYDAARIDRVPLVLVLESAGARLSDGLAALGGFRALYRAALAAAAAGVPVLALVGRSCFGGASMLAYLAGARVMVDATRLAMSGPGIIEALGGRAELAADDPSAVAALMGGPARARFADRTTLAPDTAGAQCAAVRAFLADARPADDVHARHGVLGRRLVEAGADLVGAKLPLPAALEAQLAGLFPEGVSAAVYGGVLRGTVRLAREQAMLTGFVAGVPATAARLWWLADLLLQAAAGGRRVALLYDSPGQALTRFDESLVLSAYVAHAARALRHCAQGGGVTTLITGECSGGAYVATTAGATDVLALDTARIHILPPEAVERVLRVPAPPEEGPSRWVETGVVDRVARADAALGTPALH
jgi:acetyl-CoA carboxylase carboxyltransferase component